MRPQRVLCRTRHWTPTDRPHPTPPRPTPTTTRPPAVQAHTHAHTGTRARSMEGRVGGPGPTLAHHLHHPPLRLPRTFSFTRMRADSLKISVRELNCLQNSIMFTPRGPRAWPIWGEGFAVPAVTRSRAMPFKVACSSMPPRAHIQHNEIRGQSRNKQPLGWRCLRVRALLWETLPPLLPVEAAGANAPTMTNRDSRCKFIMEVSARRGWGASPSAIECSAPWHRLRVGNALHAPSTQRTRSGQVTPNPQSSQPTLAHCSPPPPPLDLPCSRWFP